MGEKMVINKAIARLMKEKGVTQAMMAQSIGKKRPNDVSARLMSANMTMDKVLEMLDVLGYEVTIQPKRPGARPSGQILVLRSEADV